MGGSKGPLAGLAQPGSLLRKRLGWLIAFAAIHLPLVFLAARSLFPKGGFSIELYQDLLSSRVIGLFAKSAGCAAAASALALILGTALAILLETRKLPFRPALRLLVLSPLLLPPYMQVAAWRPVLSGWAVQAEWIRVPALILILGFSYAPLVFFFASHGIRGIPGSLIEAARLEPAPEISVTARIILPLAAPAMAAGTAVAFVLSLLDQETPALLLVPAYSTEIFLRMSRGPGAVLAAAVPVFFLSLAAIVPAGMWARRRGFSATSKEDPGAPSSALRAGPLAALGLAALGGILVVFPMARILALAGSLRVFAEAWKLYSEAILEGFPIALGAALLAAALAAMVLGRDGRPSLLEEIIAWAPLAVPGTALGAALIEAWDRPGLEIIYGSGWILAIAGCMRFFPIAFHALAAHLRTVPEDIWKAADLEPARARSRLSRIYLSLAAPGLALAMTAVAVFQSGDVAAAVLLAPPGHRPLPVVISSELHYNVNLDVPAALCVFQIVSVLFIIALIRAAARILTPGASRRGR